MIADLKQQRSTFTKRRKTLFKKASEISERTGARANIIVRSSTGTTYYGSYPSGKEIISRNTRRKGKVISPMGLIEWEEDWVEQEYDFCKTKEDYESLIARCVACAVRAHKRLEDWERKPSAEAADPGVEVDCDSEILPHKNLNPVLESFNASIGSLLTFCKDSFGHGDCNSFWTSLLKRTAGSASSGLDDREFNTDDLFLPENSAIGGPSDLTSSGLDDGEFNMEELPNFSGLCIDGHRPENSAIGGPSNPTSSGLDDYEFSMNELFALAESRICNVDRPENSAIGGPSNPTSSGLDDYEFSMDEPLINLAESCVRNGDRPESSTVGGGFNHPDDFVFPQLDNLDVDLDLRGF